MMPDIALGMYMIYASALGTGASLNAAPPPLLPELSYFDAPLTLSRLRL
jgi:hypothetical protein